MTPPTRPLSPRPRPAPTPRLHLGLRTCGFSLPRHPPRLLAPRGLPLHERGCLRRGGSSGRGSAPQSRPRPTAPPALPPPAPLHPCTPAGRRRRPRPRTRRPHARPALGRRPREARCPPQCPRGGRRPGRDRLAPSSRPGAGVPAAGVWRGEKEEEVLQLPCQGGVFSPRPPPFTTAQSPCSPSPERYQDCYSLQAKYETDNDSQSSQRLCRKEMTKG